DTAEDALLESRGQFVGQVGAVLGDGVAPVLQLAHRALDLAPAPAQLALDAHARFAHLAFEPVASGGAATLEVAQLRPRLGRRRVAGDRAVDAREHAIAGRERHA